MAWALFTKFSGDNHPRESLSHLLNNDHNIIKYLSLSIIQVITA